MAESRSIRARLLLETREATARLNRLDRQMEQMGFTGEASWLRIGGAVAGALVAIEAVQTAVNKVIDAFAHLTSVGLKVEQSRLTWRAMLDDMVAVEERLTQIRSIAAGSPFTFEDIEFGSRKLAAMEKYSERALEAAQDAAAVFGRTLNDAVVAMLAGARGEMEPLERMGVAKFEIAKAMGIDDQSKIGFQTEEDLALIWEGMLRVIERKYGEGRERLMTSTMGTISMIQDRWFEANRQMAEEGYMSGLNRGLHNVLDRMDDMLAAGTFKEIGMMLGDVLNSALDKALVLVEGGITSAAVAARAREEGEFVGFLDPFVEPGLSDVGAKREVVGLAIQRMHALGGNEKGPIHPLIQMGGQIAQPGTPAWATAIDDEFIPYINQATLALMNGRPEHEAIDILDKGIRAVTVQKWAKQHLRRRAPGEWPDDQTMTAGWTLVPRTKEEVIADVAGIDRPTGNLFTPTPWERMEKQFGLEAFGSDAPAIADAQYQHWVDRSRYWNEGIMGQLPGIVNRGITEPDPYEGTGSMFVGPPVSAMMPAEQIKKDDQWWEERTGVLEKGLKESVSILQSTLMAHVSFRDASKMVGKEIVRDVADQIASQSAIKAAFYGAEALALAIFGRPEKAAQAARAAAAYGALAATGLTGLWATGGFSEPGETRDEDLVSSINPEENRRRRSGALLVDAGSAPSVLNYNLTFIYQGPVIYGGTGGLDDWLEGEIVPRLNDLREAGALA